MGIWNELVGRACGIFLHISSLPSNQGIGCFDQSAYRFIDLLSNSGMQYWQVCPLSPTSYGDSPYQSTSTFAINPYFIDLNDLVDQDLLTNDDIQPLSELSNTNVDFAQLYQLFFPILHKAHDEFLKTNIHNDEYDLFCEQSQWWLDDYALFMAIKDIMNGKPWTQWPQQYFNYDSAKIEASKSHEIQHLISFYKFIQYVNNNQWKSIKTYANNHNINIIGDIPIFPAMDSADIWANRNIFKINENGLPSHVAGVPPDDFSKTGQLWGNPVYDWEKLESTEYSWWRQRFQRCLELYDVIRLDHFRGFYNYWQIPSNADSALSGKWITAKGTKFFKKIKSYFHDIKFIAEDLGYIDEQTSAMFASTGLPGMMVLQFAFNDSTNNKYLPHEHVKNAVLYLGTHDNDTTKGWYNALPNNIQNYIREYFRIDGNDITWDMIKASFASPARLLILTMQDILNLGSEARLNTPGTASNNWQWRMTQQQFDDLSRSTTPNYLNRLNTIYGRKQQNIAQ